MIHAGKSAHFLSIAPLLNAFQKDAAQLLKGLTRKQICSCESHRYVCVKVNVVSPSWHVMCASTNMLNKLQNVRD